MKLRGPGDLFGIRQSGEFAFKMADIYSDSGILKLASEAVNRVLDGEFPEKDCERIKNFLKNTSENKVDFRTI